MMSKMKKRRVSWLKTNSKYFWIDFNIQGKYEQRTNRRITLHILIKELCKREGTDSN